MIKLYTVDLKKQYLTIYAFLNKTYMHKMGSIDDNKFDTFRRICDEIGEERSYLNKAKILQNFFKTGIDGKGFKGDTLLWIQFLIPSETQRIYNLQNKQMLKLFARIFHYDQQLMQLDLEQEGDVSETLRNFFEKSKKLKPQTHSTLYMQEIDKFLKDLEQRTKEDEQTELLQSLCKKATALDLKMVIRLIKQDLRINAGARHILDAFGPLAYPAYQSTRDLEAVVRQFAGQISNTKTLSVLKSNKKASGSVQVMTPIAPMLANACKSVEEAFKKNPNGLYSEIKYDGERVQIHKKGHEFKFFSRNLKPVMDHKIKRFKEFIPKAFPGGGDMILDSEIILVDTETGDLLPFGTLGAHKKKEFTSAEVCLFVFDCILFNGDDLTNQTFRQRREILESNIKPIKSYVQLSESHFLKTKNELSVMTAEVLKASLEGVVLKAPNSTYQPGKRGWLKVKKDYLFGGRMADTADLVVLGAWYGSGKKGGILSIFLMGCFDPRDHLWKTVTKVHSGLDDAKNDEIHEQLLKLMERSNPKKLPMWLLCKKSLIPDYLAQSPEKMPVWEITGAEFTKSEAHTAAGISIRFPRITKIRSDKSALEANDLTHLQKLYNASKNNVNVDLLLANCNDDQVMQIDSKLNIHGTPSKQKIKTTSSNTNCDSKSTGSASKSGSGKKRPRPESDGESNAEKVLVLESPNKKTSKKTLVDFIKDNKNKNKDIKQNEIKATTINIKKDEMIEVEAETSETKKKVEQINEEKQQKQTQQQVEQETGAEMEKTETEVKDETLLFKDLIAHYVGDAGKERNAMKAFVSKGGRLTLTTKKANVAFYTKNATDPELEILRTKFQPTCRHLYVSWVIDSIREKECKPLNLYALAFK